MELCKEAGFVPTDLNENFTEDGEMCLALDKHNSPMLYLYLSSMRHIQENPSFVRLSLYLIDEKGMGLYTALTLASYYALCNTGHHFINAGKYMCKERNFAKATEIDLTPGVKFYKFMQSDIKNLSAKAATTFNKATGKFDVSTQDMYRLRKQAELTGANLEDLVNTGREASKLDYIKDKFDLTGLDEKQKGLIASLGTIGAGGSLTVDIPGLGAPIVASNPEELKAALNTEEALEALKEYEANQGLDDRKLAVAQLSVAEQQKIAVDRIKDAVILSLDPEQQKTFYKNIETTAANLSSEGVRVADTVAPTTAKGVMKTSAEIKTQAESFDMTPASTTMAKLSEIYDNIEIVNDAFLPGGGSSPVVMSEGQLYKGIVGDNVAIGTGLDKAFNQSSKLNEIMASTSTNNTGGGNTSVDGKIDININLTGAISGDKNSDIEKIFNSPQVQKQIMDTVLYKLDSYKRQQGVLS